MKTIFQSQLLCTMIAVAAFPAASQILDSAVSEQIIVVGRVSSDSISLRWAPVNYKVWRSGNTSGYTIERYIITRNGMLLKAPEKIVLQSSLKPRPQAQWENLVRIDKYAAVAAQALFGDRFEVDLSQSDVFTIVNKAQENQQRFAFALFSADMSLEVARASGLLYVDKQIIKGEKYLYRVAINAGDTLRGSIFIGTDEVAHLPEPQNFKADFKGRHVSLKWDKNNLRTYTAYLLERSDDGRTFSRISDAPVVTMSPTDSEDTRHEYAIDSLDDLSKTYHYRVRGITPFGEAGPASQPVSGKSTREISQVPYITDVRSEQNISLVIEWDFPRMQNDALKGFVVERSATSSGKFSAITENLLSPETRMQQDSSPLQVNYYRVIAQGLDGNRYSSHAYFAQLVDSIPPASPTALQGHISDSGTVAIMWKPNREPDIYGYRIYKGYLQSDEFAQITSEPIQQQSYTDHVDLNTLNENVYYRVMAVDINQNHSPLSDLLKVALPDKVRPQPPAFLPVENNADGVMLKWTPGGSEDIVQYKVFRKNPGKSLWTHIKTIEGRADSLFKFLDETAAAGELNHYTVISIDDAGLESEPAEAVTGIRINRKLPPAIAWRRPSVNREENRIILSWNYQEPGTRSFKVFRSVDSNPYILLKVIPAHDKTFVDTMIPGRHYKYRIMAVFREFQNSLMSEELQFQY
jgi:uncharacterized protein